MTEEEKMIEAVQKARAERMRKTLAGWVTFLVFIGMALILGKCVSGCNDTMSQKQVFNELEALTATEMLIKENLNDPDSYDRKDWQAWLQDSLSRRYRVRVTYTAKNALGGVVKQNTLAEVDSTYHVKIIE